MFCDDLRKLLPLYQHTGYAKNTYTVHESSEKAKVKDVVWVNADFQYFDTQIAKDLKDFFRKAKADSIFYLDCDGAFMVQGDTCKHLFLNELKSTFDDRDIYHASEQIVSTYLKLNMILNLLPNYRRDDVKVKGFIFSRPADKKYLRDLYRESMCKGKENLILNLCYDKKTHPSITLKPSQLSKLKDIPLGDNALFNEMELYHIDVADPLDSITMDVSKYI